MHKFDPVGAIILVSYIDSKNGAVKQAITKLVSKALSARATRLQPAPESARLPSVRINSPRILVVEDEVAVRKVIAMFLKYQGYDSVIATDARHALCLLEEQNFDLLLSDVMMPDMKGPELYSAALNIQPALNALFVSGYSEDMLSELPGSDVCYSYLPKPFTLAQLDNAIQEAATRCWTHPKRRSSFASAAQAKTNGG